MAYILITGASRGIGKAIAEELARRHIDLLLVARTESLLKELSISLNSRYGISTDYLAIDLSAEHAAQEVFSWTVRNNYDVQGLVNNAGYGLSGKLEEHSLEEYEKMIRLLTSLPVSLCSLYLPGLLQQPRAYILNIASTAAYQAIPFFTTYAASKAFLLRFSRGLHHELKGSSVTVTCISPGYVDTDFIHNVQVRTRAYALARKTMMKPEKMARVAVTAMLKGKTEVITGIINRLIVFFVGILPRKLIERIAGNIYQQKG